MAVGPPNVVEEVRSHLLVGKSCFLTGPGGTGKTHSTRALLASMPPSVTVIRAATTGVASLNIPNAFTLHSAFALPVKDVPSLSAWVKMSRATSMMAGSMGDKVRQARLADILLVDEISMCSAWLFELLDVRLRVWRGCADEPFGGVTLLLVGDFLQLPPVYDTGQTPPPHPRAKLYAFESPVWGAADIRTVTLSTIYRQADPRFAAICNTLRRGGALAIGDREMLVALNRPEAPSNAVRIMVKRSDVFESNMEMMDRLKSRKVSVRFPFSTEGTNRDMLMALWKDVQQGLYVPRGQRELTFKVGARVMLGVNVRITFGEESVQYVNGDRGTVVGFRDAGPWRRGGDTDFIRPDGGVGMLDGSGGEGVNLVPVVSFDRTEELVMVGPYEFQRVIYGRNHEVIDEVSIFAVPLSLAFAATVHKCQGATITGPTHVDCRMMERIPASMYVAMSRVTRVENLTLSGFHREGQSYPRALLFVDGSYTCPPSNVLEAIAKRLRDKPAELQEEMDRPWADALNRHHRSLPGAGDRRKHAGEVEAWVRAVRRKSRGHGEN